MAQTQFDFQALLKKYQPDYAFAYGSGIFKEQAPKGSTQRDFVFGVNRAREWHRRNLANNPGDYSSLARCLGAGVVAEIQRSGAGVYYHSFVPFQGEQIKYGVITIDDLLTDLGRWTSLYIAGRLQKPVLTIKPDSRVEEGIQKNLGYALNVALLLLPERFTEEQLFMTIASFSYLGDSRMQFGVEEGKIERIVKGNFDRFRALYHTTIQRAIRSRYIQQESETEYSQDKGRNKAILYQLLPLGIENRVNSLSPYSPRFGDAIRRAIANITHASSVSQTLKGIVSTGPSRSIRYAREKLERAKNN